LPQLIFAEAMSSLPDEHIVTVQTEEGHVFEVPLFMLRPSKFIMDALDTAAEVASDEMTDSSTRTVDVKLYSVNRYQFALILLYLRAHAEEPVLKLKRPLPPSSKITDAGVPNWCHDYLMSFALGVGLIDMFDAASYLKLEMLSQLFAARLAVDLQRGGIEKIRAAAAAKVPLTTAQERELKEQNDWAWKEPETDIVDAESVKKTHTAVTVGSTDASGAGAACGVVSD
jgi:hypothetical protein